MKRYELECGYGGNDCLAESADGEYILYDDHVEAMKRIAGAPVAQGLDEAYNLIAHAIMYLDEGEPGNAKRSLTDVLARLAQASAQQEEPVAWWNGIRKFDPDRDSVPPSFSAEEDTWHDIPLYAGINPCNLAAPAPSASPAAIAASQINPAYKPVGPVMDSGADSGRALAFALIDDARQRKASASPAAVTWAEPRALAESVAELQALEESDDRGLTPSEGESIGLVLRELARWQSRGASPAALTGDDHE